MSRKKVFLVAPPFSGHLHPLLGIGGRLQEIANVTVLSTPGAETVCDLPFQPILAQHEKAVWAIAEPGREVKSNPLLLYRQLKANIALLGDLKAELAGLFAVEKPDLILADFTVPVAGLVALEQGIPWWTTLPSPCVFETPDGPPAYCGGLVPAAGVLAEAKHAVARAATRVFKRTMGRLFRRDLQAIGFPGIYRADGSEAVYSPQRILALGIPEMEFPRTYPPHFKFAGPVLHTPPDNTTPVFARDGRPHVLITLGTHLPHAKARLAAVMRSIATRNPGIMFHFTHGRPLESPPAAGTQNFQEHAHISYAMHLPRYAVVIHHAGAGILNHCLRHGVPAVVIPQDYDQFDNAARLVFHGVALRAENHAALEETLMRALEDEGMKARCEAMSRVHAQQDAPEFITRLVAAL